jgi:arsenate reductase (thioredoxin)
MGDKSYDILFICTGNSARSIMAEAMMEHFGQGQFRCHSAGSQPKGTVNPYALATLRDLHVKAAGLHSKSWQEFAAPGSPTMDFVITVCDRAAGEACPVWPGQPVTAHWGVSDPAEVNGTDEAKARAFMDTALLLKRRIQLMLSLPISKLERLALQNELRNIGTRKDFA